MSLAAHLPPPSAEALAHSAALVDVIRAEISAAGGWLDFARYMQLALHAPGLGYYSAGSAKLGTSGDFVTAPELGDLLGRALAATIGPELEAIGANTIVELGAGSGRLAAQILDALAAVGRSVDYRILETSADLKARQARELERFGAAVDWIDRLPVSPVDAVVVANEVIDALPVTRFTKRDGAVYALGVIARGDGFAWQERPAERELASALEDLERRLGRALPDGYRSEICLLLPLWIAALASSLRRGSLIFIDYGLNRRDYYHEQRSDGTLICHYRHRAHGDPFLYPGLTDLSAWVDFSACAEAAANAGLTVAAFTTQAQFLLGALAREPAPSTALDPSSIRARNALKTLLLPGEMGERFKILLLRKNVGGEPLPGRDFRDRL